MTASFVFLFSFIQQTYIDVCCTEHCLGCREGFLVPWMDRQTVLHYNQIQAKHDWPHLTLNLWEQAMFLSSLSLRAQGGIRKKARHSSDTLRTESQDRCQCPVLEKVRWVPCMGWCEGSMSMPSTLLRVRGVGWTGSNGQRQLEADRRAVRMGKAWLDLKIKHTFYVP